jgi:GNAT superfamily N-acetyltransferase
MPPTTIIRAAAAHDVADLASLLEQLGYPSSADDVRERLRRLSELATAVVLVAEREGKAVGLASGHVFPALHISAPVAWLTSLVVDAQHVRAGVGRALCAAIETWARARGALRISVTSGSHREDAHAFYRRVGYDETGRRLTKTLG